MRNTSSSIRMPCASAMGSRPCNPPATRAPRLRTPARPRRRGAGALRRPSAAQRCGAGARRAPPVGRLPSVARRPAPLPRPRSSRRWSGIGGAEAFVYEPPRGAGGNPMAPGVPGRLSNWRTAAGATPGSTLRLLGVLGADVQRPSVTPCSVRPDGRGAEGGMADPGRLAGARSGDAGATPGAVRADRPASAAVPATQSFALLSLDRPRYSVSREKQGHPGCAR